MPEKFLRLPFLRAGVLCRAPGHVVKDHSEAGSSARKYMRVFARQDFFHILQIVFTDQAVFYCLPARPYRLRDISFSGHCSESGGNYRIPQKHR
jgi:hypothetical protein